MTELPTGQRLHPTGRLVPDALDEAMVRAVVDTFYARARRDEVVGPVFNRVIADADWPAHLDKITDFWSSMLLGTGRYMGRPMPRHIAIPELSDMHFQRWLTLFRMTVEELCPPAIAALFVWWSRTADALVRFGLMLAIGGAVSNAIDRVLYGAVADFFHFHWQGWSFYIFNLADVAITLGVLLLLLDFFGIGRAKKA